MRFPRRGWYAALVAVVLAGIVLRAEHAFSEPLWLDEAYSAFAAAHGIGWLWRVVPQYETHPPFYYMLLHLWARAAGDALPALRVPGLICGILAIAAVGWCADRVARAADWDGARRRRMILVAVAFAALSPPLVEMSRQVRPYPPMILVYALAIGALLSIAARAADARRLAPVATPAYLVALALMLWLHGLGALWGVALTAALLVLVAGRLRGREQALLAAGHVPVALLYLPALAIVATQAPTWIAATWVTFSPAEAGMRLLWLYAVPGWPALAALPLVGLGTHALARGGARLPTALALLAIVPVALSLALTVSIAPVFVSRTMTPATVPFLLLLAAAVAGARGWQPLVAAGCAMVLLANAAALDVRARARGPMQDWYGAIGWLSMRREAGDVVLAYPNEVALPLRRALADRALGWQVRAIPVEMPAIGYPGSHPTGSRGVVSLSPAQGEHVAAAPAIRAARTVWLVRLGENSYDPRASFLHALGRERRIVARVRLQGGIDIVGLRRDEARRIR